MKIFRRPFWQANTSRVFIRMAIIAGIFFVLLMYWATNSLWCCLLMLSIWGIMCFPAFFTQYFYVTLTDDQLILKNGVYTFWQKIYLYQEIEKVEIKPSLNFYMKVLTKDRKTFVWDYVIDLVDPKDFDELVEVIRAKGIVVETAGFDTVYPNRNQYKIEETCNVPDVDVKKFRQSLWNTSLIRKNLTCTVIITILLAPFVLVITQSVWACLGSIWVFYLLFPIYFTRHFYVILSADKLIIKNGVYSSMQKEYLYGDIARVKIKQTNNIYMQVFTKKDEVEVKRYCIDVVAPKDYKELVEMIKAKGIAVETEGLEAYLS